MTCARSAEGNKQAVDIKAYLKEKKTLVDGFLASYLSSPLRPAVLKEAMLYSLTAGGKRLRPILAMASYEACGGVPESIIQYASALEFIHTYSLIHDDLPAMDNDDLRRGKPTSHKAFGEAMAILAGDGLLTEAFLMLCTAPAPNDRKGHAPPMLEAVREVALGAGISGMVGGQAMDIMSEGSAPDKETLAFIHTRKTGALITASVRLGAVLAHAEPPGLEALTNYARNTGLAFQVIDDILDEMGDEASLGKPVGSDTKNNKMTYPSLYGVQQSHREAERLIKEALSAIKDFPPSAEPLREIAKYMLVRKN